MYDALPREAGPAERPEGQARPGWVPAVGQRLRASRDVMGAAALALVAAAATFLPAESLWRLAITLPVILLVPGYLLAAATLGGGHGRLSIERLLFAVGLSLPVLAFAALSTSLVSGGFRTGPIVAVVTAACLLLAAIAVARRGPRDVPAT